MSMMQRGLSPPRKNKMNEDYYEDPDSMSDDDYDDDDWDYGEQEDNLIKKQKQPQGGMGHRCLIFIKQTRGENDV